MDASNLSGLDGPTNFGTRQKLYRVGAPSRVPPPTKTELDTGQTGQLPVQIKKNENIPRKYFKVCRN
jgi:hypothetical protein